MAVKKSILKFLCANGNSFINGRIHQISRENLFGFLLNAGKADLDFITPQYK